MKMAGKSGIDPYDTAPSQGKSYESLWRLRGGKPEKKRGGSASVSDGALEGTRPTGGRLARKHGGKAKKGMNVNIIIGGHGAHPAEAGMMPPMGAMPKPAGIPAPQLPGGPPPGMMPPGGGAPPPPMPPPGAGAMPPPMIARKEGGRVKMYMPKQHGAGGGLGRLQKIKAYGLKPA